MATRKATPLSELLDEPYTFEHNGTTYTIPSAADIPSGELRAISRRAREEGLDELEQFFLMIEPHVDKATTKALEAKTMRQLKPILTGWQEYSQASLGE